MYHHKQEADEAAGPAAGAATATVTPGTEELASGTSLVKHEVCFLRPFYLELGDVHTMIFLRWGKGDPLDPRAGGRCLHHDFPRCQELLKS